MLKRLFQPVLYRLSQPLVRALVRSGISANALSTWGLLLNAAAALVLGLAATQGFPDLYGWLLPAGGLVLLGGFLDVLDGQVARSGRGASPSGALLDSVLDRYAEILLYLGLGAVAYANGQPRSLLAAYLAISASLMVSYTRARAESLGGSGSEGLFQRPERIVLISLALMAAGLLGLGTERPDPAAIWRMLVEPALWLLAAGAAWTALGRLSAAYRQLKTKQR
jgi:CDP-diacylglycerol---glycerol-3-phosphate 3-phosphatidyltransferase